MYHDQALIPIKTLTFWDGVNVTLGLPIVRTSPDHGTAFDIAGTGKADAAQHDRGDPDGGATMADARASRDDDVLPPLREVIARARSGGEEIAGPEFSARPQSDAQDRARRGRRGRRHVLRSRARARRPDARAAGGRRRQGDRGGARRALPAGAGRDRRRLSRASWRSSPPTRWNWTSAQFCRAACAIAANLPYNVGTALLVKWLTRDSWPPFWASLTLMFQREVAERIVAKPGSEHYGRLSVLAQWRTQGQNPVRRQPQRLRAAALGHLVHRAAGAAGRAGGAGAS